MIALPYLAKPLEGEPCNGCGYCCQQEVCQLGLDAGVKEAPCSLLVYRDGRTYCGLVLGHPGFPMMPELVSRLLGVGLGCCAEDPT